MSDFTLEGFEEPIPYWATAKATGELVVGLQLFTKDGRRTGNAFILNVFNYTNRKQHPTRDIVVDTVLYVVVTDMGNVVRLAESEIDDCYYLGDYIMDIEEAMCSRITEGTRS